MPVSIDKSTVATPAAGKPSRLPVFLSFAFPGLGQMVQKRWVSGIIMFIGTLIGLVFFIFESCRLLFAYYSLMYRTVGDAPSPRPMLAWLGFTLVVYILAVWDANESYKRLARKQNRERLAARLQDALRSATAPPPLPPQAESE